MHGFQFDKPKPFPMSFGLMGAIEKSKTKKIAAKVAPTKSVCAFRPLSSELIVVAIDATKPVTRHALEWALSNVVQPGDRILLLALLPAVSGWKFWRFKCDFSKARIQETKKSCQSMMEQLVNLCDAKKVQATMKVIPASDKGTPTIEAKKARATWVVLDRHLKREEKICIEQLQCNLVTVDRYNPKILRLNLKQSPRSTPLKEDALSRVQRQFNTPSSSPDVGTSFTSTDHGNSPFSESSTSPFSSTEPGSFRNFAYENPKPEVDHSRYVVSESDSDDPYIPKRLRNAKNHKVVQPSMPEVRRASSPVQWTRGSPSKAVKNRLPSKSMSMRERTSSQPSTPKTVLSDLLASFKSSKNSPHQIKFLEDKVDDEPTNVRKAVSLPQHSPLEPPPLCSICHHKAPVFGRPPREFTYEELSLATGGFSQANFLAEGGFGSVHRGILPEGQVVAVKQHKLASLQGDVEFCSEVEVLSCAQHRNVVMLIGYCIEDSRRLLVYEYICNTSLDQHLYGKTKGPLEWKYRQRIAIGAARGLRYLHEECRVGCIVHRDMRPNNILLTHDYEPMVGDFGLARWQPDGELGVETRVIGTFGYLAPEYTQSGQITEKADVFSFGIVLLELVTGRKAIDISRPKGQQCLTEWARPLLKKQLYQELVDPRLTGNYDKDEVSYMLHAAFLCISRDPIMRPRMSQVLRILEGEMTIDVAQIDEKLSDGDVPRPTINTSTRRSTSALTNRKMIDQKLTYYSNEEFLKNPGKQLSLEELKAAYRDRASRRRLSYGDVLL